MQIEVQRIDPLTDPRWPEFIDRHPDASIFHTRGWLNALHTTYGFEPVVYTTSNLGENLANGVLLCDIKSWATGNRMVSLPFSDHCQPLTANPDDLPILLNALTEECKRLGLRTVELKPLRDDIAELCLQHSFKKSSDYYFHEVDISANEDQLFKSFHRTCVRVKIGRAEREHITYQTGRSAELVSQFYDLLLMTRRKHHLPPPPIDWFRNLIRCLEENISVRVAYKDDIPIASIVTAIYNKVCFYKYTGINQAWAHTGATQALVWQAIVDAKAHGAEKLDFGRTELDNTSLAEYKDRWAGKRSQMVYYRYPALAKTHKCDSPAMRIAKAVFSRVPDGGLKIIGKMLYRHIA